MKKLKDIIYDYNDILLAIIIIIVAGSVIFWKVFDIMAYPSFAKDKTGKSSSTVDLSGVDLNQDPVEDLKAPGPDIETGGEQGQTGTTSGGNTETNIGTQPNSGAASGEDPGTTTGGNIGTTPSVNSGDGTFAVKKDTKFTVPSGYVCSKIADKLENEKLCSAADFKAAAKELNAESKLRAGDFNIPAGSTAKDIVKIIANIK